MGPKKMMSMETKSEIIKKHEQGVRVVDLAKMYGRSTSMICTVLKRKELIKCIKPARGVTIISKQRTSLHEKMEKLLLVWLTEKQLQGETLTQGIICEKARAIYDDLLKEISHTNEELKDSFKASRGWFDNFRKRTGIDQDGRQTASSDVEVFIKMFSELIEAKGYIPQQVFNCDETGLLWKIIPNRTSKPPETGPKSIKELLTLVLCANASGDCKIKPLLVYHLENPRVLQNEITKENLQVMWRANPRACVTRTLFVEWLNLVFGSSVKKYLQENDLPLQALLVLDNSPVHLPNLEDDLLEDFKFIKIIYLPPSATAIVQPMDQVISNFKKLYEKLVFRLFFEVTENRKVILRESWKNYFNIVKCLRIIDQAWQDVTTSTLIFAWEKLWPEAVAVSTFEEFEPEVLVEEGKEEIACLGKSMDLDVDERDDVELVREQSQEVKIEELHDLHLQQHMMVEQKISVKEEPEMEEVISTRDINEILGMWEKVVEFVDRYHPEKVATSRASELFNDTCLNHFRNIVKRREEQNSLDNFYKCENEQNVTKKANTSDE